MVRTLTALLILATSLTFSAGVRAGTDLPASLREVGFDQKVNDQAPLDLTFHDEDGRDVQLRDYFHGRPVILVLAYFKCPMLCTEVLNGLVQTMLDMPLEVGKDYEVITVSFDPRETPAMATAKKKTYIERLGRDGAEAGWHFLTGDEDAIRQLTDAVGFRYRYDARNDQYAHASGIMALTPEGKIFRYFFDIRYGPRDLRLSLVEASQNRIGSRVDQVLLYCFHYDPTQGKYGPAIMNLLRVGGVLTVLGIGLFVGMLWRKDQKEPRTSASGP
jgi:protein SCO1/2